MSVADKITRLTTARDNIRTALSAKGVDANQSGFEDFADDIGSISNGDRAKISQIDTVDLNKSLWYFALTHDKNTDSTHCDFWCSEVSTKDFGYWKIADGEETLTYVTDYKFIGIVFMLSPFFD